MRSVKWSNTEKQCVDRTNIFRLLQIRGLTQPPPSLALDKHSQNPQSRFMRLNFNINTELKMMTVLKTQILLGAFTVFRAIRTNVLAI